MPDHSSIDITDLVEKVRSSFVTWGTKFIITAASEVPWLSWLGLPIIKPLFEFMLTKILEALSVGIEMQAFFTNTAIKKASQAKDFVNAVEVKNSLPPIATKDEYEKAELNQMAAFRSFVLLDS